MLPVFSDDDQHDLVTVIAVQRDEARAALADVLDIVTRIGGYMTPQDQAKLRNAHSVNGGR